MGGKSRQAGVASRDPAAGAPTHIAGGYLEMNVYNLKKIHEYVVRSLMLVTALAPVIGYAKAAKIAHHAADNDLTLKDAALQRSLVSQNAAEAVRKSRVKQRLASGRD